MVACLEMIDEALLCNPFSVYADVCYVAAVKREPQNGVSRGSPELERVTEEEEEEHEHEQEEAAEADPESDESDDDDEPELVSPVHAGTAPKWSSGVYLGNEPSEALTAISLPPVYHAVDTKVRCFVSRHNTYVRVPCLSTDVLCWFRSRRNLQPPPRSRTCSCARSTRWTRRTQLRHSQHT